MKGKYNQGSGGVTSLARELAQISEELESVKAEMDQRGSSMTDAAPLVKIKQALTRLKAESTQMEIRLGVVSTWLAISVWETTQRGLAQYDVCMHIVYYVCRWNTLYWRPTLKASLPSNSK